MRWPKQLAMLIGQRWQSMKSAEIFLAVLGRVVGRSLLGQTHADAGRTYRRA